MLETHLGDVHAIRVCLGKKMSKLPKNFLHCMWEGNFPPAGSGTLEAWTPPPWGVGILMPWHLLTLRGGVNTMTMIILFQAMTHFSAISHSGLNIS